MNLLTSSISYSVRVINFSRNKTPKVGDVVVLAFAIIQPQRNSLQLVVFAQLFCCQIAVAQMFQYAYHSCMIYSLTLTINIKQSR